MGNALSLKKFDKERYIGEVQKEFSSRGMVRGENYFESCFRENLTGDRVTILAYYNGVLAGCSHLVMSSHYPFYKQLNIPEIKDLNVFPEYRKMGIATNIIMELEKAALQKGANTIGIGVGLFDDYGNAQRLYTKLGYIPDGNGIQYDCKPVQKGTYVFVDDDLVLYYTKKLV